MSRLRSALDWRDMKAAYVVSDDNGYYDSQAPLLPRLLIITL